MSDAPATDTFAPLSAEDQTQFTLHDLHEVRWHLRSLIEARVLIGAQLMPDGLNSLTSLLELYDDDTLLIDGNHCSVMNQRALQADYLICVSHLNQVRIQFHLHTLTPVEVKGCAAFRAPMPEWIVRLQRRELFRLATPPAHQVHCTIPVAQEDGQPDLTLKLRVLDISGGGVGLMSEDTHDAFFRKNRFANCELHLPDVGNLTVTLEICHVSRVEQHLHQATTRLGCRFVDLPFNLENQLLSYIFRIERARNAQERGQLT